MLPLDDLFAERANATLAGRPQLAKGKCQLLFGGMGRLSEGSIIDYKNASHAITAELEVPANGADGVIVAVGGSIGGWALYAKAGQLRYAYNFFGLHTTIVEGKSIPPGCHQVRVEFAYDGNGIAKGGCLSLYLDGNKVGEGRLEQTEPFIFSADETLDIGFESGSSVTSDYNRNRFSGEVNWVQIDVSEDANDLDHFLTRQERLVDRGRLRRWITSGRRLAQRLVAQGMSRPASGRGSGDTNTLLSSACRRLALPCEGRRHAAPCLKASQQAISPPETSSACWEPLPPQLYANHGQGYSATSTWP